LANGDNLCWFPFLFCSNASPTISGLKVAVPVIVILMLYFSCSEFLVYSLGGVDELLFARVW